MAAKVQRVALQARKTFSNYVSRKHFQDNWTALNDAVRQVTATDLNLDLGLVQDTSLFNYDDVNTAPVTYIHIWEDNLFTMGIFVLRNGVRLPMHDHPGMHGILKIIHGSARIRSFTQSELNRAVPKELSQRRRLKSGSVISADRQTDSVFSAENGLCALTPSDGNFHEIQAVNGPTAFLDVLAPPYDPPGGRECHYFKEYKPQSDTEQNQDVSWLVEVTQPDEFWCDSAPYRGPVINPQTGD